MASAIEPFRIELEALAQSLHEYRPAEAAMRARALADLEAMLDTDALLSLLGDVAAPARKTVRAPGEVCAPSQYLGIGAAGIMR